MAEAVKAPYTQYIKKYGGWGAEICALWLPGAGIAAKLIEKAPLEDVEIWLRGRARGGHVDVPEVVIPAAVAAGGAAPAVPPAQQPPAATALELGDLLHQYDAVRESEPFHAALGSAVHDSLVRLESFVRETTCFENFTGAGNGLWPAFAFEWKLSRSLKDRLSASAIVSDHAALRSLIEADLAAGLIDGLMGAPGVGPEQPQTVERHVRVFVASPAYRWPGAEGFRPGYVMANVTSPLSPLNLQLASNVAKAAMARHVGPLEADVGQMKADKEIFNARLGGLSPCGRDELTRAWLRSCAASELSPKQREANGMAPNPFLSRLQHPLIHIDQENLLEEIRNDVEAALGPPDRTQQFLGDMSFYSELEAVTRAFAVSDANAFDEAAKTIDASLLIEPLKAERVGRVLERLRRTRGWI